MVCIYFGVVLSLLGMLVLVLWFVLIRVLNCLGKGSFFLA
jgi:hypothetical protein